MHLSTMSTNNKTQQDTMQNTKVQKKPAHHHGGKQRPSKDKMLEEIEQLESKIKQMLPAHGVNPFSKSSMKHKNKNEENAKPAAKMFDQLPISKLTKQGLFLQC